MSQDRETGAPVQSGTRPPSIRSNSLARLLSNGARLAVGLVSATVTARWLGPADKGTLSSLLFVGILLTYGSSLGLGDAAVVLRGQRFTSLQNAISTSLVPALCASLVGVAVLWIVAIAAEWSAIYPAVLVGSFLIPVSVLAYVLTAFENARERLVFTSAVSATRVVIETGAVLILVATLGLGILGGVLAALLGALTSLVLVSISLGTSGYSLRPKIDRAYLQRALRFGLVNEGAFLLAATSERLDLLIVYAITTERSAGIYAVALTLSSVAAYAPTALTAAAFPRLALLDRNEASLLTARIARLTVAAGGLTAIALALCSHVLIPSLFGDEFESSVAPTLILLLNAVPASLLWALTRAASAQGSPRAYWISYGTNLAAMVALDLLLIPSYGAVGAALGSLIATLGGLAVCLVSYSRQPGAMPLRSFIPSLNEVQEMRELMRWIISRERSQPRSEPDESGSSRLG